MLYKAAGLSAQLGGAPLFAVKKKKRKNQGYGKYGMPDELKKAQPEPEPEPEPEVEPEPEPEEPPPLPEEVPAEHKHQRRQQAVDEALVTAFS